MEINAILFECREELFKTQTVSVDEAQKLLPNGFWLHQATSEYIVAVIALWKHHK
jgi:hypothetical protein